MGITFFDTADVYGAGHSEKVLGRAARGRRDEVVIATKFGCAFDAAARTAGGLDVTSAYVRQACADSLGRLGTDRIDLYQLHAGDLPLRQALDVAQVLDGLREAGMMIRVYGWSTDNAGNAGKFAQAARAAAIQHDQNVLRHARHACRLRSGGRREHLPDAAGDGPADREVQRPGPAARRRRPTRSGPQPCGSAAR